MKHALVTQDAKTPQEPAATPWLPLSLFIHSSPDKAGSASRPRARVLELGAVKVFAGIGSASRPRARVLVGRRENP